MDSTLKPQTEQELLDLVSPKDDAGDDRYELTPKGLALLAMMQVGLVDDHNDPRIDGFWTIFSVLMDRHGYVEELEDGD